MIVVGHVPPEAERNAMKTPSSTSSGSSAHPLPPPTTMPSPECPPGCAVCSTRHRPAQLHWCSNIRRCGGKARPLPHVVTPAAARRAAAPVDRSAAGPPLQERRRTVASKSCLDATTVIGKLQARCMLLSFPPPPFDLSRPLCNPSVTQPLPEHSIYMTVGRYHRPSTSEDRTER